MANPLDSLLTNLEKADGGIAMTAQEFAEAQFGIPLKHYCLQYVLGSTGLRYGAFYLAAGKPKSCKSPFVFDILKSCCQDGGISYLYELEGKASPTLIKSMFSDTPELITSARSPFKLIKGLTLDKAQEHLVKNVIKTFKKANIYSIPLCIDWDSISGAGMTDVVEKIEKDGSVAKGFYDKPHVMKYLSENWSALVGNLPIVFVGVLQEKEGAAEGVGPMARPKASYGGGSSQLFKAGTLLSFAFRNMPSGTGKIVTIKTAMNGFADARKIEAKFVWDQFGNLETESQGHKWCWAEASAQCLANPVVVGQLRDIIDVKMNDQGLVTCTQLDVTKVTPTEFEESLFSEEHADVLENLYRYHKIEKIKTPSEYAEFVEGLDNKEKAFKEANKAAAKEEREAMKKAEEEKEAAKKARKEAKALKKVVE